MKSMNPIVRVFSVALLGGALLFPDWSFADVVGHAFDSDMKPILVDYIAIQEALAADSTEGVRQASSDIAAAATTLDGATVTGAHAEHYRDLPTNIRTAADELSRAETLEDARQAFKQLSRPMAMWGTMSMPEGINVVYCSMAKASWLQKQGDVRNPYYGGDMVGCGEIVAGAGHDMGGMKQHGDHGGKSGEMKHGHGGSVGKPEMKSERHDHQH